MKMYLKIIGGIMVTAITIISCQREISAPESSAFDAKAAKEWYYGTFKKSSDYLSLDRTKTGKLSPDWNHGKEYKIGNISFVEFPLVKEIKNFKVPQYPGLSLHQLTIIANTSFETVVFARNSSGQMSVRVIQYVPDWQLAQKRNFDISYLKLNTLKKEFSGRLSITNWQGTNEKKYQYTNQGVRKIKKAIRNNPDGSTGHRTEDETCMIWTVTEEHMLCTGYVEGDITYITNCSDWEATAWAWEELGDCETIGSGDDECDVISTGLDVCICQIFDICADLGGGNNSGAVNSVINNLNDPCKSAALLAITSPAINNAITSFYNVSLQPINSPITLIIGEGNVPGGGPAVSTELSPGSNIWSTTLSNSFLYSGNSMSQQAWGAIIAHEILHIFISSSNLAPYMTNPSHHLVIFTSFINTTSNLLQAAFGIGAADATKLALNGLADLWSWGNFDTMSQSQYGYTLSQIQSTYQQYTIGGSGIRCQ